MRHGLTLLEMIVVTALLAVMLGIAMPPATRWRNQAAARSARDELAAGLAWTRAVAASRGGATLVLDPAAGRFWTRTAAGRRWPPVDLSARYGVRVDPGSPDTVTFRYDALGIGRITSRTVRIMRGGAEAGLTVSAYGRYRRW